MTRVNWGFGSMGGDEFGGQAAGIAASVQAFVVQENALGGDPGQRHVLAKGQAQDRMRVDDGPFLGGKRAWLVQDFLGDARLADVVEQGAGAGLDLGFLVDLHLVQHVRTVCAFPLAAFGRLRPTGRRIGRPGGGRAHLGPSRRHGMGRGLRRYRHAHSLCRRLYYHPRHRPARTAVHGATG